MVRARGGLWCLTGEPTLPVYELPKRKGQRYEAESGTELGGYWKFEYLEIQCARESPGVPDQQADSSATPRGADPRDPVRPQVILKLDIRKPPFQKHQLRE